MAETHILCCTCDDCLGPGIKQAPLPVTPTRQRFQGKWLPRPKPELLERTPVLSFSPELSEVRGGE